MTQISTLAERDDFGAPPVSAGYKVDISRGERIGRVSSEWFSRPDDERYLSLSALYAAVRARADRATARTVELRTLRVEASREDAERLALIVPGRGEPTAPTHWSFGQMCSLVGAPAGYMRQLPAPLAKFGRFLGQGGEPSLMPGVERDGKGTVGKALMAYLGLVPSEHSSGSRVRRGGITKAGNVQARRALIEGAWTYRMRARVSRKLHDRLEPLPQNIRDIAWKAQVRLCSRWRRLAAAGKPKVVVTTGIAREMTGFIWANEAARDGTPVMR